MGTVRGYYRQGTTFAVVPLLDKRQYVLVSNQMRKVELEMVKGYITAILESLNSGGMTKSIRRRLYAIYGAIF